MSKSSTSAVKPSLKKLHKVGNLSIIVIDSEIIKKLRLDDESYFIETLTSDGIIELKPVQKRLSSSRLREFLNKEIC